MATIAFVWMITLLDIWSAVHASPLPQPSTSHRVDHIVIMKQNGSSSAHCAKVLQSLGLDTADDRVTHSYSNSIFHGFAASILPQHVDILSNMTEVASVQPVVRMTTSFMVKRQASLTFTTRANAPWGLQRISSASPVGSSTSPLDYTYSFASTSLGQGADIYIVDTGIFTEHVVFGGRATMDWSYSGNMTDLDGHGTHVSGTAGGDVVGVASNANIHGIKVLDSDGGGWSSDVVAGIDFVINAHDQRKAADNDSFRGSVMSMSLASTSPVQAINLAVQAATQAGVHTVVAAGNSNADACESSPASAGGEQGSAITVGSIGMAGVRSSFSNHGNCVDIYGPGEDVVSAWLGAPVLIKSLSGTSMATPHITGIVAYAMGNRTLASNVGLMKEWVRMTALSVNDLALANNGVQAEDAEGILGFSRITTQSKGLSLLNDDSNSQPAR